MTSKLKNGLRSIIPLHLQGESAPSFCMFSSVKSSGCSPGNAPVYINVYDLTPINGYFYWAGVGVFHTGIEVYGVEYAFGAHEYPTSGVFEVEPRQCPGFKFRRSIRIGTTVLDPIQVREFMEHQSANYHGDSYHLISRNCNHFCQDICYKLTGNNIPKWVNRLARIGSLCNCILPESLKASAVQQKSENFKGSDSEKRKLRSSFGCLSSISMRKRDKEVPLFLHSHCLPPWGLKACRGGSFRES
ncbi:unnamed protein product [Cuscuta europaea]|uniref:PPPDE domain-containing protein n=1 Tax=Cuscuta europaea TaxID=41803 RepID=A0A9P0YHI3_CUSEU|nr:unnamed protein product [Cuscuta europaea]